MIGKDKILDKPRTDAEIITEEATICKIIVVITAGIEVDKTSGEIIVLTEENKLDFRILYSLEGVSVIGDTVAHNTSFWNQKYI